MELLVIRHGQSEADILHVIEGRADFELTELGHRQAQCMAEWVGARYRLTGIFASPLKRAAQTARHLQQKTQATLAFDEDLMEFQNGLIAGLPREEANRRYPAPSVKHPHTALYEMESMIQFRMRAETALSRILHEQDADAVIAIVAHGGIITRLFQSFLALPVATEVAIATGDTGIHHWRVDGARRQIVFANSQRHLEEM